MVIQLSPAAPSPYPHTGQGRDRRRRRRRGAQARARLWRIEVTLLALGLVGVTTALTTWPAAAPGRAMPPGVALVRSGLAMADPFSTPVAKRQLMDHYVFNGSAAPGVGWINGGRRGLEVGVHPHRGWAGWFGVTLRAAGPDVVWHAVMSRPARPVARGMGEAIFAVQSASTQRNGSINYVVVSALSVHGKGTWQIGSAHGVVADASTDFLWQDPLRTDTAATEPVTIRTDGDHSLTVWFGDRQVYSSHHLHMNDPAPFQAYLEVQARDIGYVASFTDFWVADAAPVTVRGAPAGTRVELDTGHGVVAARADATGQAILRVPAPVLVGTGTLTVSGPSGPRHFPGLHYAGGDIVLVTRP